MTNWDFDMSAAPHDGRSLLLAGKYPHVTRSKWLFSNDIVPEGRWEGFTAKEQPVAWMLWPSHPQQRPQ